MNKTGIVFMLLVATVFLAGCTSAPSAGREMAQDTIRAYYEHHGDWSPGLGCYEKVTGYAYNAGNTSLDTVILNFNLVDTRTGTIRDSRSVFLQTMDPGQSGRFESDLDGECIQEYRVEGSIIQ